MLYYMRPGKWKAAWPIGCNLIDSLHRWHKRATVSVLTWDKEETRLTESVKMQQSSLSDSEYRVLSKIPKKINFGVPRLWYLFCSLNGWKILSRSLVHLNQWSRWTLVEYNKPKLSWQIIRRPEESKLSWGILSCPEEFQVVLWSTFFEVLLRNTFFEVLLRNTF
jgi:hypothetical protein